MTLVLVLFRSFLEKLSTTQQPPRSVSLRESPSGFRAFASEEIQAGTRFGPFLGKWVQEPANANYAWEVRP